MIIREQTTKYIMFRETNMYLLTKLVEQLLILFTKLYVLIKNI